VAGLYATRYVESPSLKSGEETYKPGLRRTRDAPRSPSTDNPYSEAQFKTLKYRPGFPSRFDSIEHARAFCRQFFS
jgi:hypothetical protein